jgi:hypothetical protein
MLEARTDAEAMRLLAQADLFLQTGETVESRSSREAEAASSQAEVALLQEAQAFAKQVDAIGKSGNTRRRPVLMLKSTPLVLQLIGEDVRTGKSAANRQMYVSAHTFDNALKGEHTVTLDMLKQIPKAMTDPIAIFDSDTRTGDVVFMLDLKDANSATVVVPVALNSAQRDNISVNIVTTAYAKETNGKPTDTWFANQLGNNVRYVNVKKVGSWQSRSLGPLLPPSGGFANSHGDTVYNESDLVNLRVQNHGMYQRGESTPPLSLRDGTDVAPTNAAGTPEKGGKKTGGIAGKTTPLEEKQRKIGSVRIDFNGDNILPGLNAEDLEALGKSDKPVQLKKFVIDKNEVAHPDVRREDYAQIIGQALYNPDAIVPAHDQFPYFNFMSRVRDDKSNIVLLDLTETEDFYEIVNIHWIGERQRIQKTARVSRKG